jgi:hypothetical protein
MCVLGCVQRIQPIRVICFSLFLLGSYTHDLQLATRDAYKTRVHVFITIILGPNNLVQDNSGVCVKGSTCSEFEIEYDGKLEGVVELQYHSEHNKVFFI